MNILRTSINFNLKKYLEELIDTDESELSDKEEEEKTDYETEEPF